MEESVCLPPLSKALLAFFASPIESPSRLARRRIYGHPFSCCLNQRRSKTPVAPGTFHLSRSKFMHFSTNVPTVNGDDSAEITPNCLLALTRTDVPAVLRTPALVLRSARYSSRRSISFSNFPAKWDLHGLGVWGTKPNLIGLRCSRRCHQTSNPTGGDGNFAETGLAAKRIGEGTAGHSHGYRTRMAIPAERASTYGRIKAALRKPT
jgi:hypothetical protein